MNNIGVGSYDILLFEYIDPTIKPAQTNTPNLIFCKPLYYLNRSGTNEPNSMGFYDVQTYSLITASYDRNTIGLVGAIFREVASNIRVEF
eukprot:UN28392